ncbi:MAG: M4 family metallopeptidase [Bacteroidetes bacterium]|nr:M4 family metallopeptidase [Bacteroidota bacterium]
MNAFTNQVFTSEDAFIEDFTTIGTLWTAHNGWHNDIKTRHCSGCSNYWHHDVDRKKYTTLHSKDYDQKASYNKDNNNNWVESDTKTAASSHWSIEKAWDYYINRHGRWGSDYNGKRVHVGTDAFDIYNNGTNAAFFPNVTNEDLIKVRPDNQAGHSAAMLDVLAHEYTHAMIRASSNLGILGDFEARSLNEGYADIFGMRIEGYSNGGNHDWTLAENMGTYQRNFADPHLDVPNNSPARFAEPGFWSNTSPHENGGVLRRWFHLLSNGTNGIPFGGFNVSPLGIETADDIAYITLNWWLWSNIQFQEMGLQTNAAVIHHWKYCSNEHKQTARSLRAVGLTQVPIPACGIIIIDGPDVVLEHPITAEKVAIKNNTGELSDDVIFTARRGEDDMGMGTYQWTIPDGWEVEIEGNRIKLLEVENYESKELKCKFIADNGITYEDLRIVHFSNINEDLNSNKSNQNIAMQAVTVHKEIIVYPNPANNVVNIKLPNSVSSAEVEVYNLNGQIILKQSINDILNKIYTKDFYSGIYLLKIITSDRVSTHRIQITN